MSSLVFHIEADKADTNILESIKAFFGSQKVEIFVKSEASLLETIEKNKKSKISYSIPYDEIAKLAESLEEDENIDVISEIKKYKRTKI
jgi:Mg/Co/Ni transporter MgtE